MLENLDNAHYILFDPDGENLTSYHCVDLVYREAHQDLEQAIASPHGRLDAPLP